jgi:hypothetical protein
LALHVRLPSSDLRFYLIQLAHRRSSRRHESPAGPCDTRAGQHGQY